MKRTRTTKRNQNEAIQLNNAEATLSESGVCTGNVWEKYAHTTVDTAETREPPEYSTDKIFIGDHTITVA